jgi:phosphoribosylamine--glycine ligase
MGDPETQPIMMRLKTDLVDLVEAAIAGKLDSVDVDWDIRVALGVVLAAAGYPDSPRQGDVIEGLDVKHEDAHVFHAGTAVRNGQTVCTGGRVLCVTALGGTVREAQMNAYAAVDHIKFDGMQYRKDIGHRAIKR